MARQRYELKIGVDDPNWFVGVRPPITDEVMEKIGGNAMHGWAVEQSDSDTVFRKYTNASREATLEAAEDLKDRLVVNTGATVIIESLDPVDMRGISSPFDERRGGRALPPGYADYYQGDMGSMTDAHEGRIDAFERAERDTGRNWPV